MVHEHRCCRSGVSELVQSLWSLPRRNKQDLMPSEHQDLGTGGDSTMVSEIDLAGRQLVEMRAYFDLCLIFLLLRFSLLERGKNHQKIWKLDLC